MTTATRIEQFDMSVPLTLENMTRWDEVLRIDALWNEIGDTRTEFIRDDPEALRQMMSGLDYLVMRHSLSDTSDRIIGAVSVMNCRRGGLFKIDSLAVDPAERKKGYATALAKSAISLCRRQNAQTINVLAVPESRLLFEKLGFSVDRVYGSGNTQMSLDLAA